MFEEKLREGDPRLDPLYQQYALPPIPDVTLGHVGERYNRALARLVKACDHAVKAGIFPAEDRAEQLETAIAILVHLRDGLHPKPRDADPPEEAEKWERLRRQFWWHHDCDLALTEGIKSEQISRVDRAEVIRVLVAYLERPWMADVFFEWACVDALVYDELYMVGDMLKSKLYESHGGDSFMTLVESAHWDRSIAGIEKRARRHLVPRLLGQVVGYLLLPALAYWLIQSFWSSRIAADLAFIYIACLAGAITLDVVLARFFPRQTPSRVIFDLNEVHRHMRSAYSVLAMEPGNPGHIREVLLDAMRHGAVWQNAIFAVLDNAIRRNPVMWRWSDFQE